ncbi:helix-turn-helix domain-containing protein [Persephonella sp.]
MKVIKRELIKEDVKELKRLQKTVKHHRLVPRIQMLILLKKNPKITLKEVASLLNYGYKTVKTWWKNYKEGGLEKLLEWEVKGYKGRLTETQLEKLEEEVNKGEFKTQKEIADWIEREFGIRYTQQGISRLLKKLKVKKKVARSENVNKQEEKSKEFKEKVLKKIVKENKDKEIFFLTNQGSD